MHWAGLGWAGLGWVTRRLHHLTWPSHQGVGHAARGPCQTPGRVSTRGFLFICCRRLRLRLRPPPPPLVQARPASTPTTTTNQFHVGRWPPRPRPEHLSPFLHSLPPSPCPECRMRALGRGHRLTRATLPACTRRLFLDLADRRTQDDRPPTAAGPRDSPPASLCSPLVFCLP